MDIRDQSIDMMQNMGLTASGAKVYMTLIEHGTSSPTEVGKITKVHRVNVYDTLNSLVKKGLVFVTDVSNRKVYSAADPFIAYGQAK
jgi:sugar-specific transcriptional regulator TrmB